MPHANHHMFQNSGRLVLHVSQDMTQKITKNLIFLIFLDFIHLQSRKKQVVVHIPSIYRSIFHCSTSTGGLVHPSGFAQMIQQFGMGLASHPTLQSFACTRTPNLEYAWILRFALIASRRERCGVVRCECDKV